MLIPEEVSDEMKIAVPGMGILLNKLLVRETTEVSKTTCATAMAPGYSPLLYGEILLLKHTFGLQDIKKSILL